MRKAYVRELHGEQAVQKFMATASTALTVALNAAEKIDDWVDFGLFIEATELVDTLFGRGDKLLAWGVGRFAAEHNMGVWRSLAMRLVSPEMVVEIATGLWGHHYDAGRLVATEDGSGGLRLTIHDFPLPHRVHCLSIGGWAERTLELGRPRSVTVREDKCRANGADSCEFALRWR
jgi:hypothetical protein